ncbi:fibrous sheath CABYR-binding protein [Vicugna pacos]|uniref:Fibrous sheath CABYR-binding protein n=1 Tax=Vicugna pacos TaxID=30538 RepID=A0A6I9I234_VICPA|nr:fibrous sheath CABYR-binding protein [Vicugna pacos]
MEESDKSDQPISAGRQEIRKRRRPSQPMIDKSQQTEVTEKKNHLPAPQSSGPKAILSIGNIPVSKVNCDSCRLSSQLQQTWTKRKRVQDMTDRSLQTDTIAEEKKEEIKSVCETVVPAEKPAVVGEAAPEYPESIQEVEIPPDRHSVQLKTDRSQQTTCTGDWTMMNIPQKETADEQQMYFSELEIMFIGRPNNSFSNSKEGAQKRKSSGKIFVSEHPEFQPTTSSNEEISQVSSSKASLIQHTKKSATLLLEDEQDVPIKVQPPAAEKISAEVQLPLAEETTAEEVPAEIQPPPAKEAPADVQPAPAEEVPGDEGPAKAAPIPAETTLSEEPSAEIQPPAADEVPVEIQPTPAEDTLSKELSAEVQPSLTEEAPIQEAPELPPAEGTTSKLQLSPLVVSTAEKAPAEAEPPPAELVPDEVQPPPPEERPAEEAPEEVYFLPAEETTKEEVSAVVQPPPPEEAPPEEDPEEVQSLPAKEAPAEEASAELQPLPPEEAFAEEAPVERQPPPTEETTSEMVPVDKQSFQVGESFITQIFIRDTFTEVPFPPSGQTPADEALVEIASNEYQSLQTPDIPVVKLESLVFENEPKSEEPLKLDPLPEDSSNPKKGEVSIQIEGVIHIELE